MDDFDDFETWIIEAGDIVIRKLVAEGPHSLSATEQAIHDLWEVDYAVRNSGSLDVLEDIHPNAAIDLVDFLLAKGDSSLANSLLAMTRSGEPSAIYYSIFCELCGTLRRLYPSK